MLGSPSFHGYRDSNSGTGRPGLELGNGLYCDDQSYSIGQSWPARAPVRRALIPARRNNNYDRHDVTINAAGPGKSLSSNVDDRIHNALLEELCADFGVTDSDSYIDFLSFDIPTDRIQGSQLPADLEELGEIVSFGTVKPKTEAASGVHAASSSSHAGILGPGINTVKATSAIPDDVASPTISSSCEEIKHAEGAGEALSEFPATVHSTTESASTKPDTAADDNSKQNKTESAVETEDKLVIPPFTQLLSPSKDQQESNDSTSSSPKHVAKKARTIESGGDLLEDVKKSYAFVCGADMFAPPSQLAMSHPRWHSHTPVISQTEPVPHCAKIPGYSTRPYGYENPFQYGMHNPNVGQPLIPNKNHGAGGYGNFQNPTTPVKGFRQSGYNEWRQSPSSGFNKSYTNAMNRANMMGSGTGDFPPASSQFMQGRNPNTDTGSDIRGSMQYAAGPHYPRSASFLDYTDQYNLNYQPANHLSRPNANHSHRVNGYPSGSYGESYYNNAQHPVPQQNEFYHNPPTSPYRGLPSYPSTASLRQGTVAGNEGGNAFPPGSIYRSQHTCVNMNSTNTTEQGGRSLMASPVRYKGRPTTPRYASSYPHQMGMENNMPESNLSNRQYARLDSAVTTGQMMEFGSQQSTMIPEVQNNETVSSVPAQNEFHFSQTNAGSDLCAEQRGTVPGSPVLDRSVGKPMTPHGGIVPSDMSAGQGAQSGCHSFVRHLIGSGSGPYRSHPLFPLLRDLVIADMNFEAPSFPFPLIAGLPKSFDRLISNYFSCTAHNTNIANIDPSVDPIVIDALRYAHSALLGKICRRQLKEGHHADVPVSPVDSVCSQISQIGQHGNQESFQSSWVDKSQTGSSASQYIADRLASYHPPLQSAYIEPVPLSPRRLPSQFHTVDDSPSGKPQYTMLTPTSAGHHGRLPQHSSYLHSYSYSDMPLGGEKANRSKVLPNEAKAIMTEWLRNHQDNPYPNDDEKEALMQSTKLTINQINYWFTNARRRLLPKWSMIRRNAEEAKSSCPSPIMTP